MQFTTKTIISGFIGLGLIFILSTAQADLKQIKAYKEAFADEKPKCIHCHIDEKPKKDDGAHETNDYGKAVIKAAGTDKPTAETYSKVGKIEDFKK